MNERNILCIDLKSFFASVECVERNLDPFTTPLIVADPSRKGGAITLAVTPYMKTLGVPSRGRVFEIPKNIKYITAPPRMSLYVKKSKEVINCFLDFISKEDMHVYSIDEAFLDVTDYLKLYKMDDVTLAKTIMARIKEKTGLTSTCGIGPNLLLAKVALDIESKHSPDFIAKWTYEDVKTKLWNITPLDEMWGIGSKTMKKLNDLGIYKVGDINKYSKDFYKKRFGVLGEELYLHANGIDNSEVNYKIEKPKSIGNSVTLPIDISDIEQLGKVLVALVEQVSQRLRKEELLANVVNVQLRTNKFEDFSHQAKLDTATSSTKEILKKAKELLNEMYTTGVFIRLIGVRVDNLIGKDEEQLSFFSNTSENSKQENLDKTIDKLNEKYGTNFITRAGKMDLENIVKFEPKQK